MKRNEVFPSNWLAKGDILAPVVAKIANVAMESIQGEHGEERKPVMHFAGDSLKPMIINVGNWETLEGAYGDDSDFWTGKTVEIYVDPNVMFGKKKVGGLRVRIPNGTNGHSASPVVFDLDTAVKRCAEVGVSRDQLIAKLKARGNPGYKPDRDTVAVMEIISAARQPKEESFDDEPEPARSTGEDIPFCLSWLLALILPVMGMMS